MPKLPGAVTVLNLNSLESSSLELALSTALDRLQGTSGVSPDQDVAMQRLLATLRGDKPRSESVQALSLDENRAQLLISALQYALDNDTGLCEDEVGFLVSLQEDAKQALPEKPNRSTTLALLEEVLSYLGTEARQGSFFAEGLETRLEAALPFLKAALP